jgi:hypothetical protein
MNRSIDGRTWLPMLAIAGVSALAPQMRRPDDRDAKARARHQRLLVIDGHADVLLPSTPRKISPKAIPSGRIWTSSHAAALAPSLSRSPSVPVRGARKA